MNSLLSAIKAFVLKNRPAYKDYLGNGKYDVKKLPEECVPDSVNNNIKNAKSKADSAYDTADAAYSEAESAYDKATLAYDKALDVNSRLLKLTNLNYNFGTLEYTRAKSEKVYAWSIRTDGISDIPLVESKAPMKCNFDILLKDSNNNQIGKYSAFDKKIVRGITKISETYRSFIDERTKIGSDGYAELKIGYEFKNDDNLWHRSIYVNVKLPSADINNANISSVFLHAWSSIVDVDNYAPWPSICVPLAGTNDAGVVYASDKTDDQTVPVSIDKNGYLWCKGSETTVTVGTVTTGEPGTDAAVTNAGTSAAAVLNFVIPRGEKGETGTPDWNQNDSAASDYIKNRPFYTGEIVQTEVIPEQTYTLSSAGSFTVYADESGTYPYSLEDEKNYIVVYNGTTYELTSKNYSGLLYVGDIGPLQGIEATVPFAIVVGDGNLQIIDYNGNTEVTFKIVFSDSVINKIDTKYIPWSDAVGLKPPTIIKKSASLFTDDEKQKYYDLFLSGSLLIYNDNPDRGGVVVDMVNSEIIGFRMAIVRSDGRFYVYQSGEWEYSDITKSGIQSAIEDYLNDKKIWDLFKVPASSVPIGDIFSASIAWNSTTNKPCINKIINGSNYTKTNISDIFCSEDKEIVLSSSTANSTKKFKITVDDTGAISATEVT